MRVMAVECRPISVKTKVPIFQNLKREHFVSKREQKRTLFGGEKENEREQNLTKKCNKNVT